MLDCLDAKLMYKLLTDVQNPICPANQFVARVRLRLEDGQTARIVLLEEAL